MPYPDIQMQQVVFMDCLDGLTTLSDEVDHLHLCHLIGDVRHALQDVIAGNAENKQKKTFMIPPYNLASMYRIFYKVCIIVMCFLLVWLITAVSRRHESVMHGSPRPSDLWVTPPYTWPVTVNRLTVLAAGPYAIHIRHRACIVTVYCLHISSIYRTYNNLVWNTHSVYR